VPPRRSAAKLPPLTPGDRLRYGRHLVLPDVGEAGQRRLKAGRVVIAGAGGLGAPAALYLAAAGVGTLGLIDFDRIEISNLQRQVLYTSADIGRPKLEAAAERLRALNPEITIVAHDATLSAENALDLLGGYDVVLDGTDNFPARYLLNDACVSLGIPDVFGSVYRFEGQVSVFHPPKGPCYRCLFPEPPPPDAVPSCAEGGVLGVLPGLVGMVQATEALKLLLGRGTPLLGRLLLLDALEMRFRELTIHREPDCPRCAPGHPHRPIEEVVLGGAAPDYPEIEIGADELAAALAGPSPPRLVDVREPEEYAEGHLPKAQLIPLATVRRRVDEIDRERPVVVYCRMGGRSGRAARILRDLGLANVRSLRGGILAYQARGGRARSR
jgi:sulfur-carrier protein adenylyltransferase/sulfurtransferase